MPSEPATPPCASTLDPGDIALARALRYAPQGRSELAEKTGWSRNTVAARLDRLIAAGWVVEIDDSRGDRGRPFVRYGLNPLAALAFVARFEADEIRGYICTVAGDIVASDVQALSGEVATQTAIETLDTMLGTLADGLGVARARIMAMVVSVQGPVSDTMRTVAWSQIGVLPPDLAERFKMPVAVENNANLMALGAWHDNRDSDSLLFLLIQTGIGAGLVLAGGLHRGIAGWAGEVGHIPIAAAGDMPCRCGNRGCVAAIASNPALVRDISTPQRPVSSVADLRELVKSGDIDAIMALRQAGRHTGEAIVGLVVGLAPEIIAIGGDIAGIGDHVITGIRETLAQKTPPAVSSQIRILAVKDHDRACIRGATDLAFDLLLPSPGVG